MLDLGGLGACPQEINVERFPLNSTCSYYLKIRYSSVNGKVSVGSDNHMMHRSSCNQWQWIYNVMADHLTIYNLAIILLTS